MADSLEERLRSHARAFDGLLSIIPAKAYYGGEATDQWKRKKQTKEEARAARRAKLDPENAKSAKDVMDEKARKRKHEADGAGSDVEGITSERPREGLKHGSGPSKKQKTEGKGKAKAADEDAEEDARKARANRQRERKELKRAKRAEVKSKAEAKKTRKQEAQALRDDARADDDDDNDDDGARADLEPLDVGGMEEGGGDDDNDRSAPPSTGTASPQTAASPIFDGANNQSGTSSISSVATASGPGALGSKAGPGPTPSMEEKQARLRARIEELRAARKADVDGAPARSRQELLDSRRRKEEQRKAHKKELRRQAKEEEERQKALALTSGSPLLSPMPHSPPPEDEPAAAATEGSLSFGRVAFENGQSMTAGLDAVVDAHKRKGPQDPRTALQAVEARAARLAGLDPAKRAEMEEKDTWLKARKRAHGERARDDGSLLKKALKRKESQKRKSGREWTARLEGVEKGKAARQRKREDNIAKRREDKGGKSGKGGGKAGKGKGSSKTNKAKKPKARPGFEGSFRAGTAAGKKK